MKTHIAEFMQPFLADSTQVKTHHGNWEGCGCRYETLLGASKLLNTSRATERNVTLTAELTNSRM